MNLSRAFITVIKPEQVVYHLIYSFKVEFTQYFTLKGKPKLLPLAHVYSLGTDG